MTLPTHTKVLIVGGGPSGLTTALTLLKRGFHDFVIVDGSTFTVQPESRAITMHAATAEVLDKIGVAQDLIDASMQLSKMTVQGRNKPFISWDFFTLQGRTRFPFVAILPQNMTERVLNDHIIAAGGHVFRPYKAVCMTPVAEGIDVVFESGEHLKATYVIGADGSKSPIRHMCGIEFKDPDGQDFDTDEFKNIGEIVMADVTFSSIDPSALSTEIMLTVSPNGLCLAIPFSESYQKEYHLPLNERSYRIGFSFPTTEPPVNSSTVDIPLLQKLLDTCGPAVLSSDLEYNNNNVQISKMLWTTRFRQKSAIANQTFIRLQDGATRRGGLVLLVGDASHIHSPAGGQGMNLGIIDSFTVATKLVEHINEGGDLDDLGALQTWAECRRKRALKVIHLTKWLGRVTSLLVSSKGLRLLLILLGKFSYVREFLAWKMSGLEDKSRFGT